jgi:hypothetical protein
MLCCIAVKQEPCMQTAARQDCSFAEFTWMNSRRLDTLVCASTRSCLIIAGPICLYTVESSSSRPSSCKAEAAKGTTVCYSSAAEPLQMRAVMLIQERYLPTRMQQLRQQTQCW